MEVKINREIRNYTEAMFFGLSLRQFIFSACACVVAVGIYFLLKPYVGTETVSWMCILGAAPFAALGFVKYNGMTAEKFIYAWIKSEFIMSLCEQLIGGSNLGAKQKSIIDRCTASVYRTYQPVSYTHLGCQ